MKKLKFFLILVLTTVIALSIVACTPTPDDPAVNGSGSSTPSTDGDTGNTPLGRQRRRSDDAGLNRLHGIEF